MSRDDPRTFARKVRRMVETPPRPLTPQEKAKLTSFYSDTSHEAEPIDSYNPRGSNGPAGGGTWRELP